MSREIFQFARAVVKKIDEDTIRIEFIDESAIHDIEIFGEKEGHRITIYKETIIGKEGIDFNISGLIAEGMEIWIEVDNKKYNVREEKRWK